MLKRIISALSYFVERFLPGAFSFAIYLSLFVVLAGIIIEKRTVIEMISYWGNSLWSLLPFAMQMILILLFGSMLALSPLISSGIRHISSIAKTPLQAIFLVTVTSTIACWLNWGLGLIFGGVLAIELGKRVKGVHYPLLVASAYSGFLVWHAGISGSIPLKLTEPNGGLNNIVAIDATPLSETIFSMGNIILVLIFLVSLPIVNILMHPDKNIVEISLHNEIEGSSLFTFTYYYLENVIIALFPVIYLIHHFFDGGALNLNSVNLFLFMLTLLFFPDIDSFTKAAKEAIGKTSGIALQFPLYAGIMGMMKMSGLTSSLSQAFLLFSTEKTFLSLTYLSAGVVNFFVPSGGGQWVVQGPIIIPAADQLGVSLPKSAMALAWGDAWTNMIQPFWALPLLGISGLSLKDIMPYCIIIAAWSGFVSLIFFTFFFYFI